MDKIILFFFPAFDACCSLSVESPIEGVKARRFFCETSRQGEGACAQPAKIIFHVQFSKKGDVNVFPVEIISF